MTQFLCSFWQRGNKTGDLRKNSARLLQNLSFNIKALQDVVFKDTYNAFFKHVMNGIRMAIKTNPKFVPFTTNNMFEKPVEGLRIFNIWAKSIFPIILKAIKAQQPFNEQWLQVTTSDQKLYDKMDKQVVPTFLKMKAFMVRIDVCVIEFEKLKKLMNFF